MLHLQTGMAVSYCSGQILQKNTCQQHNILHSTINKPCHSCLSICMEIKQSVAKKSKSIAAFHDSPDVAHMYSTIPIART